MIAHTRVLAGAATVLLLMPPGALAGRIHRSAPIGMVLNGDGLLARHDATGNPAYVQVSKSIEQMQVVWPGTRRALWVTQGLADKPLRIFASSSLDATSVRSPSFGSSGATWIILRIPRLNRGGAGGTAVWELHTNGLKTPGVSIAVLPGS
jgi:hypothetical protein